MNRYIRLGVNIDHVATLRNARGGNFPDVTKAAKVVEESGADLITVHVREDRRHINENDLKNILNTVNIPLNLEIAANSEMIEIATQYNPKFVCIVPENRKEITTEGGLNLKKNKSNIRNIISKFKNKKIRTSLFINPSIFDVRSSKELDADCIEIHTGRLSNLVKSKKDYTNELNKIIKCSKLAKQLGIEVHAGHGLDYKTTRLLKKVKEIKEFNIGHYLIGESIFFGLSKVIVNFKKIIKKK